MTDTQTAAPSIGFAPAVVDAGQWEKRTGGPGRQRNEVQKQIDAYVLSAYNQGPVGLECLADEPTVAKLERTIRSAGTLHSLGIRFGGYQPSSTPGNVIVAFKVVDKINKPRKPKVETEPAS